MDTGNRPINQPELAKHSNLKDIIEDIYKKTPYKTTKKGILPVCKEFNITPITAMLIHTEVMVHTLIQIDKDYDDVQPHDQKIGTLAGFQLLL